MDKFAVIGNPVKHSLSPQIHQAFAKQVGLNISYILLEPSLDAFNETVLEFRNQGGKGCNVTVPFKEKAFALADEHGHYAEIAKSANCLLFKSNQVIYADNFDGIGLVKDLSQHIHFEITQKNILIIGAGGATQGILGPLLEKKPRKIVIANRTGDKAIELAKRFKSQGEIQGISLDELKKGYYDLIIHATSLGHKHQFPSITEKIIQPSTFCYDLSYGTAAQPFFSFAKQQGGAFFYDGIGMLIEQAAASFHLWTGVYPDTRPILKMFIKSSIRHPHSCE